MVLVGQASSQSQSLALNVTHARHCLSDVKQILESQGASEELLEICSVDPSNLTESSCPVIEVNEIENSLDTSSLLASCGKIDPTIECCNQVCQNAISAAAEVLAFRHKNVTTSNGAPNLSEKSINDCKSIILRWMASKFDPSSANRIIRVLSSCDINKCKCWKFGRKNIYNLTLKPDGTKFDEAVLKLGLFRKLKATS